MLFDARTERPIVRAPEPNDIRLEIDLARASADMKPDRLAGANREAIAVSEDGAQGSLDRTRKGQPDERCSDAIFTASFTEFERHRAGPRDGQCC